ncbi:50S ribosome-binding GTPase [Variovorax sp. J22R24]|uniref:dynamin family protein n=1 Tax=Variovorax gracilis TaxID=3053502 RepID=UPI0025786FD2|nr:dynamin family protein [Variovorax sp. J22R24]MDM0106601.1 50S ribosome-binding GTPase [Variovorax sp. J22R24]
MTNADAAELRLIEAADGIELTQVDLTEMTQLLEGWLTTLTRALTEHQLQRPQSLRDAHVLVLEINEINELLSASATGWTRQWALLEPAKLLAQAFDDRVMLLVFGKFNAGKSSLCNLLAERFSAHGRVVKYFHLDAGRIVRTTQPLQEGATETTARLQGVSLGHSMVLLDTPGLHSVTPENAALTQRFTDSADAILWLTSSTSPGQVQELNEMARELHRSKPLLPVITRSDVVEEDELDGEIVKLLRNKTPANRQLQEDDVHLRAQSKLRQMGVPPDVLKAPVSISAHVAREQRQTPQALCESGFIRLCGAVLDLIGPARAYKQRKPVEVLLHHLEENVSGTIKASIQPALSRLLSRMMQQRERLQELRPRITKMVWRQVASSLPRMLEEFDHSGDVAKLSRELGDLLQRTLAYEVSLELGEHEFRMPEGGDDLQAKISADLGYEVVSAGNGTNESILPNPSPSTVNHERLHDALQEVIHQRLVEQLEVVFEQCGRAFDEIENSARVLQVALARQDTALLKVKNQLRCANE